MNSPNECPICLKVYDTNSKFPIIVGKCGHTFCRVCTSQLIECPICRQRVILSQMIKNYALAEMIQKPYGEILTKKLQENKGSLQKGQKLGYLPSKNMAKTGEKQLIDLQSSDIKLKCNEIIYCPNRHKCLWRGEMNSCAHCEKDECFGWQCFDCAYLKCDECANTIFQSKQCPNGHLAIWVGEIELKKLKYKGQNQREDSFCRRQYPKYCGSYSENSAKACSNYLYYRNVWNSKAEHPTVYDAQRRKKQPKIGGWICMECLYIRCKFCDKTYHEKEVCPNGHQTTWFGVEKQCASCHNFTKKFSWTCKKCNYYHCDHCQETKTCCILI